MSSVLAGATIGLAVTLATTVPAVAECMRQDNEFPPYTAVAPTADRVVIGTVVENLSETGPTTSQFRIRVDEVLAGQAGESIEVIALRSGLPLHGSPACRGDAALYARVGDVLALAYRGEYDGLQGVNTVAWIEGRPPADLVNGAQTLTLAEARRAAAGLPPTDAAHPSTDGGMLASLGWPPAILLGLLAAAIFAIRRRSVSVG